MDTISKLCPHWLFVIVALLCVNNIPVVTSATQAEERVSQAVSLKLYDLSTSDWSTSLQSQFATIIASEATTYCTNSPSSCGLDSATTFSSSEVGTTSPEKDGYSIAFTFYIDYPGGAVVSAGGATAHVVPKSAVTVIAANARSDIRDQVGYYITYIDEEYYSIPPDTDTNKVIVPIAFVVVFLMAIGVVVLQKYQKHKDRQATIKERKDRKKGYGGTTNSRTSASYDILDNTNTTILTTATPRQYAHTTTNNNNNNHTRSQFGKRISTKETNISDDTPWQAERDPQKPVALVKLRPGYPMTSTSVNEFHDGSMLEPSAGETANTNGNGNKPHLSAMESLREEEDRREKKRRKKEKRRERRRREEEGTTMEMSYENPSFNNSNLSEASNLQNSVEVMED